MAVSRDQFDETKNWTEPEWQEGVPVMDADLNLAMKIGKTGLRRAVCDFLGSGSPNDGFKLSGLVTNPTVHAGNIWVAGLKIEMPGNVQASAQPNAPVSFPNGNGIWYLDVVEKLLTNADDPAIRDSRLPANVETPIKVWKTDWTLRKVLGASLPNPDPDHYYIGIALETGGALTDIRNTGMVLAGADTGYQNRIGGRPGSGHRHHDEDIDVANSNFTGDTLDEVLNEIDSRIDVVQGGIGIVTPHAATHGAGGSDAINIANLTGQCTQAQVSPAHSGLHTASFNGGLPVSPDANGNTSLGAHLSDAAIHRKNHNDLLAQQGGTPTERYHLALDLYNAAAGAAGANAANPFATVGDITGVAVKFAAPVQTVQELRDIPAANRSDKQVRLVEDKGSLYRFDDTGTGTDDGDGVIAPTSGSGRWFKISVAVNVISDHNLLNHLRISQAGHIWDYHIIPESSGNYQLGLISKLWSNIYSQGFTVVSSADSPLKASLWPGGLTATPELGSFAFMLGPNTIAAFTADKWFFDKPVDMANQNISMVKDPVDSQDAANKQWVLAHVGSVPNHNDTLNIQGGSATERYHTSAAEHTGLTGGGNTSLHRHDMYITDAEHSDIDHSTVTGAKTSQIIKVVGTGGDYDTLQAAAAAHPSGGVVLLLKPETFTIPAGVTVALSKLILKGSNKSGSSSGSRIIPADPSGTADTLSIDEQTVIENCYIQTRTGAVNGIDVQGGGRITGCSIVPAGAVTDSGKFVIRNRTASTSGAFRLLDNFIGGAVALQNTVGGKFGQNFIRGNVFSLSATPSNFRYIFSDDQLSTIVEGNSFYFPDAGRFAIQVIDDNVGYTSKLIFTGNTSAGNGYISLQGANSDFTLNGNDSFGNVVLSGVYSVGDLGFTGNSVFSVTGNIGTARLTGNEIGNNTINLTVTGWAVIVGNRCAPVGINVTGGFQEIAHNA